MRQSRSQHSLTAHRGERDTRAGLSRPPNRKARPCSRTARRASRCVPATRSSGATRGGLPNMLWTVEVDLALVRPPTVQRTSRVTLESCCEHHATLDAISVAVQVHDAAMPVGSRILDWP